MSEPVSGKALLNALLDRGDNAEDLYYAIIAKLDAGQALRSYIGQRHGQLNDPLFDLLEACDAADDLCRKEMEER